MYLDDSLRHIFQSLPSLPFSKLLRAPAAARIRARKAFFKAGQLPTFTYPKTQTVDLKSFRSQARIVRQRIDQDPSPVVIKTFYLDKLAELEKRAMLIEATAQADDRAVSRLSLELYGQPDTDLEAFETEFAERRERSRAGEVHYHDKTIDALEFKKLLEQALKHYRVDSWEVKLSPRKRLLCSHDSKMASIVLRVPKKLSISRERARRLIAHEIEVHTLRRLNGADSQLHILKRGLAGYSKTEEGLALYHQHRHDIHRKHLPGFWDAWASSLMYMKGFAATYDRLFQAQLESRQAKGEEDARKQARHTAWNLCVRACRGIIKPGAPGIGYFRDHIYRHGYIEVAAAVKKSGADNVLPQLFVGKAGLSDLPALRKLKLKPGRLPDGISHDIIPKTTKTSR